MSRRITRRRFIRASAATALGLFLEGCGVNPTATPEAASTLTPRATDIPAPTSTTTAPSIAAGTPVPTATHTPAPLATLPFRVTPTEWGIYTIGDRAGLVDPRQMYALVGAINQANRSVLPVGEMNYIKIAVDTTGADLTALSQAQYTSLKYTHLSALESATDFSNIWRVLVSDMQVKELNFRQTTVIWDPAAKAVKLVVCQDKDQTRRFNYTNKGLQEKKEFALLPNLKVEGAYIKRADSGEVVTLKGLNQNSLAYLQSADCANLLRIGLRTIVEEESWGINLVRVGINCDYITDRQQVDLDKLVDWAEEKGIYLIITPFMEHDPMKNQSVQPQLPSDRWPAVMANLAKRYLNRNHLMYALFNEPAPDGTNINSDSVNGWINSAKPISEAIRTNNPNSIVVVPAPLKWAREGEAYYLEHPYTVLGSGSNIMYDIHPFQMGDFDQMQLLTERSFAPVLYGEAGITGSQNNTVNWSKIQKQEDIDYLTYWYNFANAQPGMVHYSALGLNTDQTGLLNPPNYDTTLPRGGLLKADLSQYPPYAFVK